jgi:hypothetical protein
MFVFRTGLWKTEPSIVKAVPEGLLSDVDFQTTDSHISDPAIAEFIKKDMLPTFCLKY